MATDPRHLHKANEGAAREAGMATVQLASSKIANTGMHHNDCKAYCLEVSAAAQRAFERRGFAWVAESASPAKNEPRTVLYQAGIFLQGRLIGFFDLKYTRRGRSKRLNNGMSVNTHHPIQNRLWIEVSGFERGGTKEVVAQRSHSFRFGAIRGGRPKLRSWAAYAAKTLHVHYVNQQAEYIHEI